jgi:hypothetical protein
MTDAHISTRAEERVLSELAVRAKQHRVIARECLDSRTQAVDIEMHKFAAELYEQLLAAAPGVFNDRDALIAAAEDAMKEADRG